MSPFKTKKLPNKTRESSLIQSKPTPREDIFTIKKM
jgi:hypothetical protein